MFFLSEKSLDDNRISWSSVTSVLKAAVTCLYRKDYSQPIKPYLRYGDPKNRIIAMPAYVGGNLNVSGIKWIASFPGNRKRSLPRAHSLIILNCAESGRPQAVLESNLISAMRTAGVSSLIMDPFLKAFNRQVVVGFSGFGHIGKTHLDMIQELFLDYIDEVFIFDQLALDDSLFSQISCKVRITKTWQEAYRNADLFITCTTTSTPYIDLPPKPGSLHLDVSLRDYKPEIVNNCQLIIVDDWNEVCRENTDIERAHLTHGLKEEDVHLLSDVVENSLFQKLDHDAFLSKGSCLFAPMGMGTFDIALAQAFYLNVLQNNGGINLEEVSPSGRV